MREMDRISSNFRQRTKQWASRIGKNDNFVLAVVLFALIGVMAAVTKGLSITQKNMMNVLWQSSIRGMGALGQACVVLSGGLDLSLGGVALFAGLLGSSLMTGSMHQNILGYILPTGLGILIVLLVATGFGLINGLSVSRVRIPALIATLAVWRITEGLGYQLSGGLTIHKLPAALELFGSATLFGVYVPVIIFIVSTVIVYLVLNYTPFGRSIYAVGGSPTSAWLSGIDVKRVQLFVYTISGFMAGMSSLIYTGRIMLATMETAKGLEIDSIIAVSIGGVSLMGGRGSVIGVFLGVLIFGVINNAVSILGAEPTTEGIVKGLIIFTAVAIDYKRRQTY